MAIVRTRNKSLGQFASKTAETRFHQPGGVYLPWGFVAPYAIKGSSGYIQTTDVSGNLHGDNPFDSERRELKPGRLNGLITSPSVNYGYQYRFNNTIVGIVDPLDARLNFAYGGVPSDYINKVLARGNPNRPDLDLLNAIWELKDIAHLLHKAVNLHGFKPGLKPKYETTGTKGSGTTTQVGYHPPKPVDYYGYADQAASEAAGAGVQQAFGWGPLLSDLQKVLGIADAIDNRLGNLTKLKRKVVTRRFKLSEKSTGSTSSWYAVDSMVYGTYERRCTQRVWAIKRHTIHAAPYTPPPRWTRSDAFHLAFNDDPTITLWNSLPWSWLVDYFFDVGTFLAATGNRIPGYAVQSICIMQEDKTELVGTFQKLLPEPSTKKTWSGDLSYVPLKAKHTRKQRYVESDPSPQIPNLKFLEPQQFENLNFLVTALFARNGGRRYS